MQKLVTIFLDDAAYNEGKFFAKNTKEHGFVEEHLDHYLSEGWTINDLHGFGGSGGSFDTRGWITVALEKE